MTNFSVDSVTCRLVERILLMKPMLDPKRDLAGATPETLARALFRHNTPLRTRHIRKSVVRDEVTEEKPSTDKTGNGVSHLSERP